MAIKNLTKDEVMYLSCNPYVCKVTERSITYTADFKQKFIQRYKNGAMPREIFQEYGFDPEILGRERIKSASKRWLKTYKTKGIEGLYDQRGMNPLGNLSPEVKLARLEAQNQLLKAENELLKKLHLLEGGISLDL